MDIDFNEFLQYYDLENHSAQQTAEHFNVSVSKIMTELKKHNFHKDKNKHVANIKKTKKEHFGDENYNNRIQAKQTCLDKYNVDNFNYEENGISVDVNLDEEDYNIYKEYIKEIE